MVNAQQANVNLDFDPHVMPKAWFLSALRLTLPRCMMIVLSLSGYWLLKPTGWS